MKELVQISKAINHPVRQELLTLLNNAGGLNVTEIQISMRTDFHSEASRHLGILRRAKLITPCREGKIVTYSLNKEKYKQLEHLVNYAKQIIKK
jgi:DNA-binding transcriptional ArsR family regulator